MILFTFHHQLMSTSYQVKTVHVTEFVCYQCAEEKTCPSGT